MSGYQFNSFWHGNELSPVEWACLSSFVKCGHKVRLFCYDPVETPDGVSLAAASDILPKDDIFLFNNSVSAFSDLFRYKLLSKYGEWWTDTDVYCLKEHIPECSYAWANQDADQINGALLKFPRNDRALHELSIAANKIGQNATFWSEVGPHLLTEHLTSKRFDGHFGNREEFYPIHWLETFLFWMPGCNDVIRKRCRNSYFVHVWTSVFPQMGMDRYVKPPSGSFLENIYAPHLARFNLQAPSVEQHNGTIKKIRTYCNYDWVVDCSTRLIGYNVTEFPFDDYIIRLESSETSVREAYSEES
jgi:hypothetical protein